MTTKTRKMTTTTLTTIESSQSKADGHCKCIINSVWITARPKFYRDESKPKRHSRFKMSSHRMDAICKIVVQRFVLHLVFFRFLYYFFVVGSNIYYLFLLLLVCKWTRSHFRFLFYLLCFNCGQMHRPQRMPAIELKIIICWATCIWLKRCADDFGFKKSPASAHPHRAQTHTQHTAITNVFSVRCFLFSWFFPNERKGKNEKN